MRYVKAIFAFVISISLLVLAVVGILLFFAGALKEAPFSALLTVALFLAAAIGTTVRFLLKYVFRGSQSESDRINGRADLVQNAKSDLDDIDPLKRRAAIETLYSIGNENARAILAKASNRQDTTQDVRVGAALGLAKSSKYSDQRALNGLIEGLADESRRFRNEPVDALRKFGLLAAPRLRDTLAHDKNDVRRLAIGLLGDIKDPDAVDALILALEDPNPNLRMEAAAALGKIGIRRATPYLVMALLDENQGVRQNTVQALRQLPDLDIAIAELLTVLKSSKHSGIRETVIGFLGKTRNPDTVAGLIDVLRLKDAQHSTSRDKMEIFKEADNVERRSTIKTLGNFGSVAKTQLCAVLRNGDWLVRGGAAEALGHIKDISTVQALLDASLDEEPYVQWAATWALGEIGDVVAFDRLVELLNANDWAVRREAVSALGKLGDERAMPALEKRRDFDSDERVRNAAHTALSSLEQWRREQGGQSTT